MSALTAALKSIIVTLTIHPASPLLMAIAAALALVAAWFSFGKIVNALRFPMNSGWRPLASLALFILACLAVAVLTKAHLSPRIASAGLARFLPLIAAVVIFLAAVVPLSCFLMKSHYFQTLAAFLVPVVAAAIASFIVKGAAGAIEHGGKGFSSTKERTEGVDQVLQR